MPASFGVQGPGESTIASGSHRHHVGGRNLVVAMHDDVRPQPAQVMEQVEGEAVVIVDQNDHVCLTFLDLLGPLKVLRRAPEGGQAAAI